MVTDVNKFEKSGILTSWFQFFENEKVIGDHVFRYRISHPGL